MIDNTGWNYIWKIWAEDGRSLSSTNVLYTPTINPEKDKMCMHFVSDTEYMKLSCVPRTEEMLQYWFERELNYLKIFQGKLWCPTLYDVDYKNKKILIEFNKESLNRIIYDETRLLDIEHPTWKDDLFEILKDLYNSGYHKASIYTHCFFYSNIGQLKMIDYYATIPKNETRIHKNIIEPIIGVDSQQRFIEVKDGDYYEMGNHFKNSLKTWIKWPGDPLPEFYDRLTNVS